VLASVTNILANEPKQAPTKKKKQNNAMTWQDKLGDQSCR